MRRKTIWDFIIFVLLARTTYHFFATSIIFRSHFDIYKNTGAITYHFTKLLHCFLYVHNFDMLASLWYNAYWITECSVPRHSVYSFYWIYWAWLANTLIFPPNLNHNYPRLDYLESKLNKIYCNNSKIFHKIHV